MDESSNLTSKYYVYILRCSDNSFYVGHTQDVAKRVATHNSAKGAVWTAARLPVTVVYQERCDSKEAAIQRENQIKRWSRAKKQALIDGDQLKLIRSAGANLSSSQA
ncbi:MAG: GIY-YIG nuclease family protein [Pirellulaceae bacterium]|nr:GIY-YIG nuclease family protein [Pirellulaceae bacterium]